MDKEELGRQARKALAAAGDMAARGVEWAKNYRDAHRAPQADEPSRDGDRRIYGVTDLAPQSTGFRAFNAFRLMITPMIIRIIWLIGAYIVWPIRLFLAVGGDHGGRYGRSGSGDVWMTVGLYILGLVLFRLTLEVFMAIFRIHEDATKTTELTGRLVRLEERRQSARPEEDGK